MGRPRKQKQGLGDTIEQITEVTGIKTIVEKVIGKDCGCKERKEALNKLLPYRLKVVNCPNEQQTEWYNTFLKERTLTITNEQRKMICELHAYIYNVPYFEPCINCSSKPYIKMIDNLDKIFKDENTI